MPTIHDRVRPMRACNRDGIRLCFAVAVVLASAQTAEPATTPALRLDNQALQTLAQKRFPNLSYTESRLLRNIAIGENFYYRKWDDPIRPAIIRWLCSDRKAMNLVPNHKGINVRYAQIKGNLYLQDVRVPFPVVIKNSRVDGVIYLSRAHFKWISVHGTQVQRLIAKGLRVEDDFWLAQLMSRDGLDLEGAAIGGTLDCTEGHFVALSAPNLHVEGDVLLARSVASGKVNLDSASIGGQLDCSGSHFSNPEGSALYAPNLHVQLSMKLNESFVADGAVNLVGASIGGSLDCSNGLFRNPSKVAFQAEGLRVEQDVRLSAQSNSEARFEANGEVNLDRASVGGDLDCSGGHFSGRVAALSAEGLNAGGNVKFGKNFLAEGPVNLSQAIVGKRLIWQDVLEPAKTTLNLDGARVGFFVDQKRSWPRELLLDGFVYERITDMGVDERLRWLKRHPNAGWLPQPYKQLAEVLQRAGREDDAKTILVAMNEDPQLIRQMGSLRHTGHRMLGWLLGYGYRPWNALWFIAGFLVLGGLLFSWEERTGKLAPIMIDGFTPAYNPVVYAIDAFVPLVDLRQTRYRHPTRAALRLYFWIHVAAGWLLTALLAAGVGGLVRR